MRPSIEPKPQVSANSSQNSGWRGWFVIQWRSYPKEKPNRASGRGIAAVLANLPDLQPNWHGGGAA